MRNRLRHSIYWLAVAAGFIPAVFIAGTVHVGVWMECGYSRLRRWTHQDKYGRFDR